MKIRNFKKSDFTSVKSIYQQGIDTGNATFQMKAKEWNEWNSSFLITCRIVAELNNEVVGWAALSAASKWSLNDLYLWLSHPVYGSG